MLLMDCHVASLLAMTIESGYKNVSLFLQEGKGA